MHDVYVEVPDDAFQPADFRDNGHFVASGSLKFARQLAPHVRKACDGTEPPARKGVWLEPMRVRSDWEGRTCREMTGDARRLLSLPDSAINLDAPVPTSGADFSAMPLHWTIDSRLQTFVAVCNGDVDLAEVHQMLDAMVGVNGLRYRKLFDGTHGETKMGPLDILGIGVRMRALQAGDNDLGALAVVVPDDKYALISRVLGILAAAKRPMRVFNDADKARRWLDSPAIRGDLPAFEGPAASA